MSEGYGESRQFAFSLSAEGSFVSCSLCLKPLHLRVRDVSMFDNPISHSSPIAVAAALIPIPKPGDITRMSCSPQHLWALILKDVHSWAFWPWAGLLGKAF